jgi:zinc-binding alcohol dehydrogenase/oxidoreductase
MMTIRVALKHLDVLGTAMGSPEEFGAMLDLYADNSLRPKVNETFALEDTAQALRLMEEGGGMGKIVLRIPA